MSRNIGLCEKTIDNLVNIIENTLDRIEMTQDIWKKTLENRNIQTSLPYGQERLMAVMQRFTQISPLQPDSAMENQKTSIKKSESDDSFAETISDQERLPTNSEIQHKIKTEHEDSLETSLKRARDEEEWLPRKIQRTETNANVVSEIPKKKKKEPKGSRASLSNMEVIDGYVTIGSLGTKVAVSDYDRIDWSNCNKATRGLMNILFSRPVMATSSLSGKCSPAFRDKQKKPQLNPVIINDITECILRELKVEKSAVRIAITTKCADECKLFKKEEKKSNKRVTL